MRKIVATGLIIVFLTVQYSYTNAACKLCEQSNEMVQRTRFTRPESEEVEFMFEQLELNEKVELINPNDTFKIEYMDAEFLYVSLCDNNSYLLVKKEGNIIGAVNYNDGEMRIVLSENIQPELICVVICFVLWGQSSMSILACPLVPLAKILYPDDQELHNALFSTCGNGIAGMSFALRYSLECFK